MPLAPDKGQLVFFIERGFITHRSAQSLGVAIAHGDLALVAKAHDDPTGLGAALTAFGRATSPRHCGWHQRAICGYDRRRDLDESFTIINVAWPELRAPRRAEGAFTVTVGEHVVSVERGADLSGSIAEEFSREAPARIGRAVARVAARQVLVKAGDEAFDKADEEKKKNKNGLRAAGIAAYIAAGASMLSERADTRSWALLPDELVVRRMSLAPGTYVVRRGGFDGEIVQTITVREGGTTIVPIRDWGVAGGLIAGR